MKTLDEIAARMGTLFVHLEDCVEPRLEKAMMELGENPARLPPEWNDLLAMENYFVYYSAWLSALEWVVGVKCK